MIFLLMFWIFKKWWVVRGVWFIMNYFFKIKGVSLEGFEKITVKLQVFLGSEVRRTV